MNHEHDSNHTPADEDPQERQYAERPNKSEGKRQTRALRDLVLHLAGLRESELNDLPLTDRLREAIDTYRSIRPSAHGGRRRQLQLLVKIARDEDMDSVQEHIDNARNTLRAQSMASQHLVDERSRILASAESLEAFIAEHDLDNEFRSLARRAQRELAAGTKPQAARTMLRKLQQILNNPS